MNRESFRMARCAALWAVFVCANSAAACPPGFVCGTDGGNGGNGTDSSAGSGGINSDSTLTARNGGNGGYAFGGPGTGQGSSPGSAGGGGGGSDSGGGGGYGFPSPNKGGGGGGAGGGEGQIVNTTGPLGSSQGGAGGRGGNGAAGLNGGHGGGGGGGGSGAAVAAGLFATVPGGVTIQGGIGGSAGTGETAGSPGGGGHGVRLGDGASLTNDGMIQGGNGAVGGVGVRGSGVSIVNAGNIAGGFASDGTTRANAILFSGGTNALTLESGAIMTGNVVAASTGDTLAVGGNTNASFDLSQVGASAQFQGFGIFAKSGSSTWMLTGPTDTSLQAMAFQLTQGSFTIGDPAINSGIATLGTASFAWSGGSAVGLQLGAQASASDMIVVGGPLTKIGSGSYLFHFGDGTASPATCGTVYQLIQANSISGFSASDFSFDYSGSNPAFGGNISLVANSVVFTFTCSQTIAFPAQSSQIFASGGTFVISPAATASSGLAVTYSSLTTNVCTVNGNIVTMHSPGKCVLAADQAGNTGYQPAAEVTQSISINAPTVPTPALSIRMLVLFGGLLAVIGLVRVRAERSNL